jgi:signal transduction histidine kinase/ligand-binding sensor domain-containing protein/CheY-like chemotaxis protein
MPRAWCTVLTLLLPTALSGQALVNMPRTEGPAPGFVLESWTVKDGLPVNSINKVIQSKSGYIWLATFDGLVRFDGVRFTTFNIGNSDGLPTSRIIDVMEDSDGSLLLTTEFNQLVRFRDGKFTPLNRISSSRRVVPESLSVKGPDGKTWVATRSGIFVDGRLAYTRPQKSGYGLWVTSIAADHEGSLWFGTIAGGLHQIKRAVFVMYGINQEPSGNNLYSVTPAKRGGIWAGTWGNISLSHIDGARVETFGARDGIIGAAISLHEDRTGRLWVGPLVCRLPETKCSLAPSTPPMYVHAIHEDSDGTLWFGTATGLFRRRNDRWESFPKGPKTVVRAFERTRDGALWMATNGAGLIRFKDGAFTSVSTREGLPSDLIRALHEDESGRLWIGTEGKGLARIDPRQWTSAHSHGTVVNIRTKNGLFDDGIHTILEDNSGRVWMSTNRGIFWVPQTDLDAFADGRATRVRSTSYTERHGLRNREANGGSQPAATKTPDGKLWFATQDGVAMVDAPRITTDIVQPNVMIENVNGGRTTEITPDKRDLRIEYTALTFLAPENVRFRYRLSPYDKTWVDADTRRTATYTRVPPGSYTFEVMASNGGDAWSSRVASLDLHVTPRFIETTTFKLIVVLGIALVAWAALRYRLARLRKLAADLQLRVDERTRELRESETELAERNAQLEVQADQLKDLDRAKTQFFANVSHELRTPLTLTIGPLEDARAQLAGANNVAVSRIDMALRNSRRLFRLVNQILDVSKLEAGGMKLNAQPGNFPEFIRGIAAAFAGVAERKKITFHVEGPDDADVWFDHDALEKVIANLLSNAFKFTPERGQIVVAIEISDDAARVRVSDSGPGIPVEHLPHVFDRFYQVDETNTRAQPGTGIGLALARELAELHGGTLEVESDVGGATFVLSIPTREIAVLPADVESQAEAPASNGTHAMSDDVTTLLVVDDNADLRSYVRSRFESRYRIIEAADGADAIRRSREIIPDLVISDVMMPGMDGHALCAALRASPETDFVPVILLTAQGESAHKIAGLERGADDYIVKPFDMRELEARVENLIASRRRLRERFSGAQVDIGSGSNGLSETDSAFVKRLKAAIETGLSDPEFGVGELAKAVFQDRSHLFRRTRELLGESPSDLLRRVRLERAAELLRQNRGSVAEVAYAAGFNSVSNFCRTFRVMYGATPSEYRSGNTASTTVQPV